MVDRRIPSWVNPITIIGTTIREEYRPNPAAPSTRERIIPITRLLMVTDKLLPKTESMSLKYDLRAKGFEAIGTIPSTKLVRLLNLLFFFK
jgi:hypothetical protein